MRLAPESPIVLNNLAWSLAFGGKPELDRALKLIDAALAKGPGDPRIRDTRGRILAKQQRWSDAIVDLEACAKSQDGVADFHSVIAEVYEHLNLAELAERHRRRAAELAKSK